MADNRKDYYLKLKENFFDSDSIVLLEDMKDGILRILSNGRSARLVLAISIFSTVSIPSTTSPNTVYEPSTASQ